MAKKRSSEFRDFCVDGKRRKFGALTMEGTEVYSYGLLIAKVDREHQTVFINRAARGRSVTTSRHCGSLIVPKDWTEADLER